MDSEKFLRAVELYKNRDHQNATQLLAEMIKEEPNNPDAWYLLALCTNELSYKQYCLQKALEINPQHQAARAALNNLDDHVLRNIEQVKPASIGQGTKSTTDWLQKLKIEPIIKVGTFILSFYYLQLLNSPVWSIEDIAFAVSGITWIPRIIFDLIFGYGILMVAVTLIIAITNLFIDQSYKKWIGIVWIILGCEFAIPTYIAGLSLNRPEWKSAYWTEGPTGLVIIGLIYILFGLIYVITYQNKQIE
jgi:hypothetical protein